MGLQQATPVIEAPDELDEREAFLLRASACHDLVELGEPVDEVFDGLIDQFLQIVLPLPRSWAEGLWDNPGWRLAAIEYHVNRQGRPSLSRLVVRVVKGEAVFHPDIDFYRAILDPAVSFDAAYRDVQARRGGR
jgi:hypothetical protein